MTILSLAADDVRLRREHLAAEARIADAVAALHRPGAPRTLIAEHLRWLRDRRRRIRLELDTVAELAAELLGRDVARAVECEPCPPSPN